MSDQRLAERILKLKQEISTIGLNYPLMYVHVRFIEKMELDDKNGNTIFRDYLGDLNTLVDKCLQNYEDYGSFIELKNKYSEALMFSVLNSVLRIEKIPENDYKSPDFKINYKGSDIYIEMKSLNMVEGTLKHKDIMEVAFEGKIRLEKKLEEKKKEAKTTGNIVVTDIRIDRPYYSSNKPYNDSSPKLVIETLIDKIHQNIKEEQFGYGDTALLIDFSDQLSLPEDPNESLQQDYIGEFRDNSELYDYLNKNNLSPKDKMKYLKSIESVSKKIYLYERKGCLWHVMFGDVGTILLQPQDTVDGKGETLERQGVLKEYDFIKGIMFYIDGKFYASMQGVKPEIVFDLFSYLSYIRFIENRVFSYKI